MPYIITHGFRMDTGKIDAITSTAVTTRYEAREAVSAIVTDTLMDNPLLDMDVLLDALTDEGGSSVALPNGSVIEVEQV